MRYLPGATPRMEKRPRLSVRPTRSKGSVVKAESCRLECKPTSIPFTGSRSAALSRVPDTTIESMRSPVEKVKAKSYSGLPSLLSSMASEKSMVYVVLGFSVSTRLTTMRLPLALISGCSTCGGEITTFSPGFSSLRYSSNSMRIFFSL